MYCPICKTEIIMVEDEVFHCFHCNREFAIVEVKKERWRNE